MISNQQIKDNKYFLSNGYFAKMFFIKYLFLDIFYHLNRVATRSGNQEKSRKTKNNDKSQEI